MPAMAACIIAPIWDQFHVLLPPRTIAHPLGWHRQRIPEPVVFDTLVQVLVFGCADERIAATSCSATTCRWRRDEWIAAGVLATLHALVLDAYDRMIGLELGDLTVDGCITKAPCGGAQGGRSPVDRGKPGLKRSTIVDATGIPLGAIAAPANHHASPLVAATPDTLAVVGPLPSEMTVHLDPGYDSHMTRELLSARGLHRSITERGKPAPLAATQRWVVERPQPRTSAHKELVWCPER